MSSFATDKEFQSSLRDALSKIVGLTQEYPEDAFIQSIHRQLLAVSGWIESGSHPSNEQLGKLSFGVMASRAVDELDPELAHMLYRLANHLDAQRQQ